MDFFGTLLFTILVPGTVVVLLPILILSGNAGHYYFNIGAIRFIGLIPLLIGSVFYFWSTWNFVYQGAGTPAPIAAPKKLVYGGAYKYVRNPMYIGILLILSGEAVILVSISLLIYTCIVAVGFHLFVVLYEEPHLYKKFGVIYDQYCKNINRWRIKAKQ